MRYQINAPTIVCETIDDETIIINFDTGTYYSCRGMASRVWTLLEDGHGTPAVPAILAREFVGDAAEIQTAVDDFITQLVAESIIVASAEAPLPMDDTPNHDSAEDSGTRPPFVAPKLEQFTDMQELLLLDPIHEVGDLGWPQRKA